MAGQPLNGDLVRRGAYLVSQTRTASSYRLYALPDGKRPALVRTDGKGAAIEVEVWSLPAREVGGFPGDDWHRPWAWGRSNSATDNG